MPAASRSFTVATLVRFRLSLSRRLGAVAQRTRPPDSDNRRDASLQAQDRAWQPLLDGTWRERALEAVRAVADSLRAGWPASAARGSAVDASLAGGAAGLAVLFAYLGEAGRESADQTAAQQWLARAVQAVSEVEA